MKKFRWEHLLLVACFVIVVFLNTGLIPANWEKAAQNFLGLMGMLGIWGGAPIRKAGPFGGAPTSEGITLPDIPAVKLLALFFVATMVACVSVSSLRADAAANVAAATAIRADRKYLPACPAEDDKCRAAEQGLEAQATALDLRGRTVLEKYPEKGGSK